MSYLIYGNWRIGWALDVHTLSSTKTDDGFATTRSDIGNSLYLLKYSSDVSQIEFLSSCVVDFLNTRQVTPFINVVIPTPPL